MLAQVLSAWSFGHLLVLVSEFEPKHPNIFRCSYKWNNITDAFTYFLNIDGHFEHPLSYSGHFSSCLHGTTKTVKKIQFLMFPTTANLTLP